MPNEAGDSRLTANLRRLIDSVSADPTYNPSNAALKTTALESLYSAGMAASQDVGARMATHKLAINDRQTGFACAAEDGVRLDILTFGLSKRTGLA